MGDMSEIRVIPTVELLVVVVVVVRLTPGRAEGRVVVVAYTPHSQESHHCAWTFPSEHDIQPQAHLPSWSKFC